MFRNLSDTYHRMAALKALAEIVKEEDIETYNWCTLKGKLIVAALNDRDVYTREEAIKLTEHERKQLPRYKALEMFRIINDVYRIKSNGEYRIEATPENREKLYVREFGNCLRNNF